MASGGWAPLRTPAFRRLWTAQFVSNIGTWMQTVGAQWVMLSLTSSAVLVGAISAAGSLPVLLLSIPGGALGDLVDRRRLIFVSQTVMLAGAAALAIASALSALTPALILGLLFVIGCGAATSAPTWQTLQPELVPAPMRTEAIALGSVNQNLARAVGPALGGVLLAATSAAVVFGVNALSFVVVLAAIAMTAVPKLRVAIPREHARDAIRAGGRYVRYSPALLALIARAIFFILPAGAVWALLPLVAHGPLGLGATGYGLLLGCVGIGAFAAASLGPAARRLLSPRALSTSAAAIIAATGVVLATSSSTIVDAFALVCAGAAWISALGLLGAAYQSQMPNWVKSRGMAYYLIAFQGSNAIGGLLFGAVAQATTLDAALVAIAVCLLVGAAAGWRLAFPDPGDASDLQPGEPWPLPDLDDVDAGQGPVLVVVQWLPADGNLDAFLVGSRELRRIRRRSGATSWRLYRSAGDRQTLVETYVVGSWADHERQHARLSIRDRQAIDVLDKLLTSPRTVAHYVAI